MKQIIMDLAEQADMVKILEEHAHEYGNGTFENTPYPELEKFAELIVRECGEVAYKAFWDNPETVRGVHIQEKIKQHFGVEE
jgi:hypothetical protein